MIDTMPADNLTGRLLLATPALTDANFERTVVLVLAHDGAGALGLVLNRPTEVRVADVLDGWAPLAADPAVVFEGGPVQPEAAICLAWRSASGSPTAFKPVDRRLGTVDLSVDPLQMVGELERMRIFAGYAGWGAGQLEGEVSAGAWLVFEALPDDAFAPRPENLWSTVLRRQGGMLAALAQYPADPALN